MLRLTLRLYSVDNKKTQHTTIPHCDATQNANGHLSYDFKWLKSSSSKFSGADSMEHKGGVFPHFYKWRDTGGGTVSRRTAKSTDSTVLTITKALSKTTNCAFRAKKWRDTTKKYFFPARAPTFAPYRSPTFKFVPAPPVALITPNLSQQKTQIQLKSQHVSTILPKQLHTLILTSRTGLQFVWARGAGPQHEGTSPPNWFTSVIILFGCEHKTVGTNY